MPVSDHPPCDPRYKGVESSHTHNPSPHGYPLPHKEPPINAPVVIVAIILILAVVHGIRAFLPFSDDLDLLLKLAFIPARLTVFIDPAKAPAIFEAAFVVGGEHLALARFVLAERSPPWGVLTYAFLHGSWMHLVFNSLWLLAFGAPVARRFGAWRFLALFLICSVAGALFFWIMRPVDVVPMVGASGAISGVMAAAIRFIFSENGPGVFGREKERGLYSPARPLIEVIANKQALGFIIAWFAINLITGFASGVIGMEGTIAWEAHIGGFLAGLILFVPLDPVPRSHKG